MKTIKYLLIKLVLLLLFLPSVAYSIPAFPGAEGLGANSVGGRGGQVIKVTNLNDSGSGSFRTAVTALGKRIVVFTVSGVINLSSEITISNPYITIAGQTSPGGILVAGRTININTHDVIIQHMRFRVGSHRIADGADPEKLDALDIAGNYGGYFPNAAHDIIIDHSSFSWSVDELASTAYNPTKITIQWSIFSEALSHAGHPKGEHSKGFFIWGKGSPNTEVSFHHNYIAHNHDRNPLINAPGGVDQPLIDAVNNVVYNWYAALTMQSAQTSRSNWVHNYAKPGPDSIDYATYEVIHEPITPAQQLVYVKGNIGVHRTSQSDPEWSVGNFWHPDLLSESYRRLTPWPAAPVTTHTMSLSVANCILTAVGATAPVRDSVDTRVVANFASGTGAIIDNVKYPDDYPTFSAAAPPADSDNDGMADSWETANGLNTGINDAALDKNGNGYTNIEEYLHYLSSSSYTFNSDCMPMPIPYIEKLSVK